MTDCIKASRSRAGHGGLFRGTELCKRARVLVSHGRAFCTVFPICGVYVG